MHAQATQENPEQPGNNLGFLRPHRRLTIRLLIALIRLTIWRLLIALVRILILLLPRIWLLLALIRVRVLLAIVLVLILHIE